MISAIALQIPLRDYGTRLNPTLRAPGRKPCRTSARLA
jgi:hypothetical protein